MTTDNPQLLIIDRPCTYCQVLELKDAQHGGQMQHDEHEKGTSVLNAIEAMSYVRNGNSEELKIVPKTELKLGYKRKDAFSSLPGLATTALQGCAFCKILREDLISSMLQNENMKEQDSSPKTGTSTMELVITEVTYQFRDFGVSYPTRHKDAPRISLDALYVYFTIHSGVDKAEHSIHYNFYADASDSCARWFSLSRLPALNDRLSIPYLNRMRTLIGLASKETPIINNGYQDFQPTRLLDLNSSCTSDLRLIVTKEDPEVSRSDSSQRRYAALSYCWGSASEAKLQLKTTHDTLNSHLSEIQVDSVPKTISDAIKVCRCLGIRYLWVDTLCIIQGDGEDWSRESFAMSQIYSNSFLALCIIQGNSCSSGFLKPVYSPSMVQINFKSELNKSISGSLYLRMLFPPRETIKTFSETRGKPVGNADDPSIVDFNGATWATRGDWYILVDAYMQRKLSFEQDKFPAISALARSVCDRFPKQRYLAGLWESDLHKGLLWTTTSWLEFEKYYKPHGSTYIAPSWSWACRPYNISWISGITSGNEVKYSPEFTLTPAEVLTEKENPYGRVSKGQLFISGKNYKPPLHEDGQVNIKNIGKYPKFLNIVFNYILWSEKYEYVAHIFLDWDYHSALHDSEGYPRGPIDQLLLLLVSRTTLDYPFMFRSYGLTDQEVMLGILVRLMPGTKNEYEKLGLWYSENRDLGGKKFWENISLQDLILV
ncbi:hypothetical protein BCON_0158g00060 [Botryotinia convoluta]|uniref:Heterokaryon incompatibility domain-containing protein n=1 Tax=Botryotinia convoluta TaxID=54673 RepID=A0A4Z1HYP6_9HELO|nr:hypothetical protein BCON_0158g00060 [Botryotinia convoluta]